MIQATRGCPFFCSFCSVPSVNPGFRVRPVQEVVRDIQYDDFPHWWQRKVVWFWDDNLTARRPYVKELLRAMIPLKKWWLTQASMDIARDAELLDLMQRSGCIGVFLGIESFGEESLRSANKRQNKIAYYKDCIDALHRHGIAVMAGFIAGFDGDTPQSILEMADRMCEIGVDVPFLSILTPYKGTALWNDLEAQDRLSARARLAILQRLQRRLSARGDDPGGAAPGASTAVEAGLLTPLRAQAAGPLGIPPAPGSFAALAGDERILRLEGAARQPAAGDAGGGTARMGSGF